MLIKSYKTLALICTSLWNGIGVVIMWGMTIPTAAVSLNLIMGLLFFCIGWVFYFRGDFFYRGYSTSNMDVRNNLHIQRFLRLDLILMSIASLLGAILLYASIYRVFEEGFAVFG